MSDKLQLVDSDDKLKFVGQKLAVEEKKGSSDAEGGERRHQKGDGHSPRKLDRRVFH